MNSIKISKKRKTLKALPVRRKSRKETSMKNNSKVTGPRKNKTKRIEKITMPNFWHQMKKLTTCHLLL